MVYFERTFIFLCCEYYSRLYYFDKQVGIYMYSISEYISACIGHFQTCTFCI